VLRGRVRHPPTGPENHGQNREVVKGEPPVLRSEGDVSSFVRLNRNILNRWWEYPLDSDACDQSYKEEDEWREEQEKDAAQSQHRANDYRQDVTADPPPARVGFGNHELVFTIRTTKMLRYIYPSVLQP
jgi:hypothetical protein